MPLTLKEIKENPYIEEFIKNTYSYLKELGFTDHGFRHTNIVADRAKSAAKKIGMNKKDQELCAIAGYCHDMGNFLGRTYHHYWSALLFSQLYREKDITPKDLVRVMQALVAHDKEEIKIMNKMSAVVVLADKSDVHRSRVLEKDLKKIKSDIHDRVNYAVTDSDLLVNKGKKLITLRLKVDTKFTPVMEYFEIFTERMAFCRTAAERLGYNFSLVINKFKLL